ncbi:MAG: hypothetical protein DWH74_03720, partial [Planctomycetota bacterium]
MKQIRTIGPRSRRNQTSHTALSLLTGAAAFLLALSAHAQTQIKLSGELAAVKELLLAKSADGPHILVVDRSTLDAEATSALLATIDDLQSAGSLVFAVCPRLEAGTKDGAAIVAMACNGIALIKKAELEGATAPWCTSNSRREEITAKLGKLGCIDLMLAERFLKPTSALSWSPKSGFKQDGLGAVKLAQAGAPLKIDATTLNRVAGSVYEFETIEEAVTAIASGTMKKRTLAPLAGGAPGKSGAPGAPIGSPAASPNPAAAPPNLDAEIAAKLVPYLKKYATELAELQASLKEFDKYYIGTLGVWTGENKNLHDVWVDGSDNTRHKETKIATERLQREMKANMSSLRSAATSIEKIAKNPENPDVVRTKAQQPIFDGLRDG